ncbi:MAG: D-alanyl-D-alanine carboxypeptidase/D-alanyl-D-alanine-endopeptidase [Alphaproteobacteria bacterium]|nr:D-alanyl-D-alanine carboxypeptidase/D-alanyl-D-alanine-endopeptidase [Alphaproteobacteria bacterium]MBV9370036.1 D-alanyl-D-alanine carboxypeptidase/D-alanyl-D-alanine-endopeptidase [Alphaproteobacteria bacterium]MBV9901102.1 D-alanyl-D-alanine carboxypeptidase/D-alanyl-D-alanine-endopeptidase [Alphaproteobacteria bacterium]
MIGRAAFALLLLWPAAVAGQPLQQRVEAKLAEAGPGPRFGLVVATEDGRELVAIQPEGRFIPASNTKVFTTAAAFAILTGLDAPDAQGGASVGLEGPPAAPNVVLEGHGDARLSSAADCRVDCLGMLADAVAARTKRVAAVIGDDRWFPDERWSPGMSWNNIPTPSGTAVSALTLDDNELVLTVTPAAPGAPPRLDHLGYYSVDNRATTVAGAKSDLRVDRLPGSLVLRISGTVAADAAPQRLRLGVDDPAHYAAWRLKALLEARGVKVAGAAAARHRALMPADDADAPPPSAAAPGPPPLARLTPPPLGEDIAVTNKVSQNLHAELLLRRIARVRGGGSIAQGLAAVRATIARAGLPRPQYDFSDGSGMSTYNRIAPRGMVTFLRWTAAQPWGAAWRRTLPVAGVEGTLASRFKGTALEGKLAAKTGSLNGSAALSGFLTAKSGRTLVFSLLANDVPEGVSVSRAAEQALLLVAGEN